MKKLKLVLGTVLLSLIFLIGTQNVFSVNNPLEMELSAQVSTVNSLYEFNDKLYAGTTSYGGIIISHEEESGWEFEFYPPNSIQIYSLCEYQGKLFAGTANPDGKIYVYDPTTDGWDLSFDPPNTPYDPSIRGLCVYNGILYASTTLNRYIYAYDGYVWTTVYQVSPYFWLGHFAVHDDKLFLGVGPFGAIYMYDGLTWEKIWESNFIREIFDLIEYKGVLYASGWGFNEFGERKGYILAYDDEENWDVVFVADHDIMAFEVYGNNLYASGADHTYTDFAKIYSFDGGNWEQVYIFTPFYERFIWSMTSYHNRLYVGGGSGIYVSQELSISATVDFDPDTLNLKSKGKWVTVYIELPDGYYVGDIDLSTILFQDLIPAELSPSSIGDYDEDGILDLMVKFDRTSVQSILSVGEAVEISVSGSLIDGMQFTGTDIIRVIDEGVEHVNEDDPSSITS